MRRFSFFILALLMVASCQDVPTEPDRSSPDPANRSRLSSQPDLAKAQQTGTLSPSLSGKLFAREGQGGIGIFDASDITSIALEQELPIVSPAGSGEGFEFDAAGNLYVGGLSGLQVYNTEYDLIGEVVVDLPPVTNPLFTNMVLSLVVRDGQVLGCNPVRTPFARLFVFDTHDPQAPAFAGFHNIPGTEDVTGRECRSMQIDSNGDLWVTAHFRLIKLTLDASGAPVAAASFNTNGNPLDIAFQPGTGHIFYPGVNQNFLEMLAANDPNQVITRVVNVCDNANNSPSMVEFTRAGDLLVSCHTLDGATAGFVTFDAASLTGLSGTVEASALGAHRNEVPEFPLGILWMAISPSALGEVEALVEAGELNPGQGTALTSKLEQAIDKIEKGQLQAALNLLQAFINQVNALVAGGGLSAEDGAVLVAAAQAIIDTL